MATSEVAAQTKPVGAPPHEYPVDVWSIAETEFPATGPVSEQLYFLLHYATLAPSGHNTQPWLFAIDSDAVELHADRTRALAVVDPEDRELVISCGAALLNLRLALRHFGFQDAVELFPNPEKVDLLARLPVGSKGEPAVEERSLFEAIPKRHTNRQPFEERDIPEQLLSQLRAEAAREAVWFQVVEGEKAQGAVIDLIAGGETILWEDKRFRRELAAWIHPNRSHSRDGIPGYAQGLGDLASLLGPFAIRAFDMGQRMAAKDRELSIKAPVLAVLGTDGDSPADWLAAGQALERVLLRACVDGVSASFLNQPIEVSELRPRLLDILGRAGSPQLLIRMGYGPQVKSTPRRPVEDILIPV
jgi:hypothetical protein